MDYKIKYKEQRKKNKILVDKINVLSTEIKDLKSKDGTANEQIDELVSELEEIREEFLLIVNEINIYKENYAKFKDYIVFNKKVRLFGVNLVSKLLDIRYEIKIRILMLEVKFKKFLKIKK